MVPNQRIHIGIFGKTNAGKSSFLNFLTQQQVSIVSPIAGTTTDPLKKNFELDKIGAVTFVDTAGLNDNSDLGQQRNIATAQIVKQVDIALLLFEEKNLTPHDISLITSFKKHNIPFLPIHTKSDIATLSTFEKETILNQIKKIIGTDDNVKLIGPIEFSANTKNEHSLFQKILIDKLTLLLQEKTQQEKGLLDGLVAPYSKLLLITPIDASAPKGRLILPQVQLIRCALDLHCQITIIQPQELANWVKSLTKKDIPNLVITDSHVFKIVDELLPKSIPLTGFSMILARQLGPFNHYIEGAKTISNLKSGDKVLILESCNHTLTCEDIGRIKIPTLLNQFTNSDLAFSFIPGLQPIPCDIEQYKLVIQCGGCMVTKKQLANRLEPAITAKVPITNYGMALAVCMGIFKRAIVPFLKEI